MKTKLSILPLLTWRLAAGLALFWLAGASAQAQLKIGMIDLEKVFENYYKTKLAAANLKEQGENMLQVRKGMLDDYQKANEEYRKLMESTNDPALASEEKEKRKKTAEDRRREMNDLEDSISKFDKQSTVTIEDKKQRMREKILREIQEVIDARAKAASFTHIFDKRAESGKRTPVLLYTSGENDLTNDILAELNRNAPSEATGAEGKGKEKPAEAKSNKK